MARQSISAEERREAVTLVPSDEVQPTVGSDSDTEQAWDGWYEALHTAQAQGKVRILEVPTNPDGSPNLTSKGQVQLLTVPHDQYNFDELCNVIRTEFMEPGETKCIRIMGIREGVKGFEFNRILMIKRSKSQLPTEAANSQLGEVLRAMQESNESQARLMREMLQNKAPASNDMKELFIAALPTLGTILAAWIAKPAPKQNDLGQLVDLVFKLKDGVSPNENTDDNGLLGIIKAVAPQGLQLLNTLASNQQARVVSPSLARQTGVTTAAQPAQLAGPPAASTSPERAPSAVSISSQSQPSSTPQETTMLTQLRELSAELVKLCDQGESPQAVAELTLSLVPPEFDDQLYDLIETPKTFARLGILNKDVITPERATWFEALRVELYTRMTAPDEPANEPNAAPDAKPAP